MKIKTWYRDNLKSYLLIQKNKHNLTLMMQYSLKDLASSTLVIYQNLKIKNNQTISSLKSSPKENSRTIANPIKLTSSIKKTLQNIQ